MTEKFNRRGFLGIMTGVAAFLGFTTKAKGEKPYLDHTLSDPSNPAKVDRKFTMASEAQNVLPGHLAIEKDKNGLERLVLRQPKTELPPKNPLWESPSIKNSSFLICPQCGNDMHWARCECGFVWTNRVDEVAGGGQRQYDVKEPSFPTEDLASKTIVEAVNPAERADDMNSQRAERRAAEAIPQVDGPPSVLMEPLPPAHGI